MRTTLLGSTLALPGPTGERNSLSFVARGVVLCAASTTGALLNQLAAALATGNRAVVVASSQALLPAGLPPEVSDRIEVVGSVENCQYEYQIALAEANIAPALRPALAAFTGAIVGVIETSGDAAIPLWRLVAERAVCVNTTAAGGNASLMTLGL
jgi:RHH-type proline utilization regulon transcriptional repressor/proline dehydrogenase/delta 1-pyrroline-5-carboxylate dehydrogenase